MRHPYGRNDIRSAVRNPNNTMNMIRHHHECVQYDPMEMQGDFIPAGGYKFAECIYSHSTLLNFPKQTFTILGTDRYKIRIWKGVIISGQSGPTTFGMHSEKTAFPLYMDM